MKKPLGHSWDECAREAMGNGPALLEQDWRAAMPLQAQSVTG
jgi:hypothetical protein